MTREAALEEAGPHRLRPILMTSAVLIFSMLPVALALGDSSSGRAPLGAVLVGGMATSTLLSLLYVPVAYTYFDSLSKLGGKLFALAAVGLALGRRRLEPSGAADAVPGGRRRQPGRGAAPVAPWPPAPATAAGPGRSR